MDYNKKIILDCDPGEDDALAILLAIAHHLDVKALVCGFGNTSAENTYRNGAGLLSLAGRTDIPLIKGAEKSYQPHPLETDTVSAGDFVGKNGLCGVVLDIDTDFPEEGNLKEEERYNKIADLIKREGPLNYIITGPCGTFAHVVDKLGNEAARYIQSVIIMGGALDTAGNHGPLNPDTGKSYAEFNFYCDPFGADRVLKSGIPVILVPWDLTERIVFLYKELSGFRSNSPIGGFVLDLMRNFLESYGNAYNRSFEFNDCITISALQGHGKFRDEKVSILLEGQQAGRIVRDESHGVKLNLLTFAQDEIIPIRNEILKDLGCVPKH